MAVVSGGRDEQDQEGVYKWSQTEEEVICEISVNRLLERSSLVFGKTDGKGGMEEEGLGMRGVCKHFIKVRICSYKVDILYKGELIFSKEFAFLVDSDSSTWYFEDLRESPDSDSEFVLVIVMEKKKKGWWGSCFKGGSEIDLVNLKSRMNFRELDERTRSDILRVLSVNRSDTEKFPSSEISMLNILKQAWNEDDSPFKGTKFDPVLAQSLLKNGGAVI